MSSIGVSLNRLGYAKRFTQLDLVSPYHRIEIREDNKWKIVFCIRYYNCKWQIILFCPYNASTSFQAYINKIIAKKRDIFIIVSLDDISIYNQDIDYLYVDTVCSILEQFRKYSLFSNKSAAFTKMRSISCNFWDYIKGSV